MMGGGGLHIFVIVVTGCFLCILVPLCGLAFLSDGAQYLYISRCTNTAQPLKNVFLVEAPCLFWKMRVLTGTHILCPLSGWFSKFSDRFGASLVHRFGTFWRTSVDVWGPLGGSGGAAAAKIRPAATT